MPVDESAQVAVLVEGESDAVVVRSLLARDGLAAKVLSMDGVTNIDRWLDHVAHDERIRRVCGLYDLAEERFVVRALRRRGVVVDPTVPLSVHGFYVCDRDLEDELIRAVTPERAAAGLERIGLAGSFETFIQQPQWREQPVADQLHRFAGAGSGRKARFAGHLTALLTVGSTPAPLADLVAFVRSTSAEVG